MTAQALWFAVTQVLGWALVHFLWQATLLGFVYFGLRSTLPRGTARYRLGMGILLAVALCPLITIWHLLDAASSMPAADGAVPMLLAGDQSIVAGSGETVARFDALLPWLVLAWSLGVLLHSVRAWRQWRALKVLVHMAEQLPQWQQRVSDMAERFALRGRIKILGSRLITSPALIGWIRPVILLPMAVVTNFPAFHIELILAHELAHLRRWDPLANLFQVALETLFFHHPVVHWISADVRNEREICCDELALAVSGGNRHAFVMALAELGELREQHGSMLLAANGGILLDRVQHMVTPAQNAASARSSARFVAVMLGAAVVLFTLRLEWKQAALQQSWTESILQLQPALTPPWFALSVSQMAWNPPDIKPIRLALARPQVSLPAAAGSDIILPPLVKETPILPPLSLRLSELTPIRQLPMRVFAGAVPSMARSNEAPSPIRIRQPVYPVNALLRGIEGQVVVEFSLAGDGRVQQLQVIRGEPAGVFDQSAIQAMKGWTYAAPTATQTHQRFRQKMEFMLNAASSVRISPLMNAGVEVHAKAGCHVATGTHICRWPGDVDPHLGTVEKLSSQ